MNFLRYTGEKWIWTEPGEATHAVVPIEEYHGLLKALEIVRNKSLLQVDKAKADEHGYTLLFERQKLKRINGKDIVYFECRFRTPYSIKIPSHIARDLIEKDFEDFYPYHHFKKEYDWGYRSLYTYSFYYNAEVEVDAEVADVIERFGGKPIFFEFCGLNGNLGAGTYEVTVYRNDGVLE